MSNDRPPENGRHHERADCGTDNEHDPASRDGPWAVGFIRLPAAHRLLLRIAGRLVRPGFVGIRCLVLKIRNLPKDGNDVLAEVGQRVHVALAHGLLVDQSIVGQPAQRPAEDAIVEGRINFSDAPPKIFVSKRSLAEPSEDQQLPFAAQDLLDSEQVLCAHADTPVPPRPDSFPVCYVSGNLALRRFTSPSIDHAVKKLSPAEVSR